MESEQPSPLKLFNGDEVKRIAETREWAADPNKAVVDLLLVTVLAGGSELGPITFPSGAGINARFHPSRERGGVAAVEVWAEPKVWKGRA